MSHVVIVFRLLLSTVLSGLIGWERERHGRAAGLRTHILVGTGATLVMVTSIQMALEAGNGVIDPSRMPAQVISGIGFLGAGTIIRHRASIVGLTTAASLWAVAGVGLAIGAGSYWAAFWTTGLVLAALQLLTRVQHSMIRKDWNRTLSVELERGDADQLERIEHILSEARTDIKNLHIHRKDDGLIEYQVRLTLPTVEGHTDVINQLMRLEGVKTVNWV